jgi:hypothetical protein
MLITAFFSNEGVPSTGLSALIKVIDLSNGSVVVNNAAMTESSNGFYTYNFTSYDSTKNYSFIADGSSSLGNLDRYVYGTNEIAKVKDDTQAVLQIQKGKWEIKSNQMILFDSDGTTSLYTFDLFDANGVPTMDSVFKRVPR